MRIIVDAFGGDNAPLEILKGCIDARTEYGVEIALSGDSEKIKACAKENSLNIDGMEIFEAPDVFQMETQPSTILKAGKNTSMAVGLQALADGKGDAFVSAGSTGALLIGATFIVKRIPGVKRPVIGVVIPSPNGPFILVDTGANVECTVPMLCQFAKLGKVYMQQFMGVQNPKVSLANIGTEKTKGTKLQVEAYTALSEMDDINFTGNIEIRDIPFGETDVVVADGFTGNVILKLYEGIAKLFGNELKAMFKKNALTMLSYLGVKNGVTEFKDKMNYKKYGGAPIIGVRKTVIKAHGSSDAFAIKNAIKQAITCNEARVAEEIRAAFSEEKNGTITE